MFKKALVFIFISALFFSANAAVASTSSIMVNAEDGKVMYETNADELRYPASLTKLMTLYITFNALENGRLKLTDKLKVSRVAASRSPSKLGVRAGETITVKDAVMAVIVKSANDCATVLAEHFSKTEADFAVLMTKTARKLNMNRTTFKNASGLPNSLQKTTARDMSKLAMAVYHHFPQYYKWFSAQSFRYKGQLITGHNHLLKTFAGADGMKTGYTAASGYNIITSAKRNGKRVIAVTMGHRYVGERDRKAALMMNKGLIALKESKWIDVAALTKEINGNNTPPSTTKIASVYKGKKFYVPLTGKPNYAAHGNTDTAVLTALASAQNPAAAPANGEYAVQIGAFSDYKRAKNYATGINNDIAKQFAAYHVEVEEANSSGGVLYRSKLTGMPKNTANEICGSLKKQKKTCLVVPQNPTTNWARK